MKTKFNFTTTLIYVIFLIVPSSLFAQTDYLNSPVIVPFFHGPIDDHISINLKWDLSEVNNQNKRLDLAIGVTQKDEYPPLPLQNFNNGNWYYNQYDQNFNGENTNTRFVYDSIFGHGFLRIGFFST